MVDILATGEPEQCIRVVNYLKEKGLLLWMEERMRRLEVDEDEARAD